MFEFAEVTKDMTASEILNYYRNLYYAEPQVTERGIVANAINDYFADVVPKSEWNRIYTELEGLKSSTLPRLRLDLQMANTKVAEADMAKNEVAREIFEELETKAPWFCENQTAYEHFNEELAELKKKYIGGNDNG
jgi:hypothetical protein